MNEGLWPEPEDFEALELDDPQVERRLLLAAVAAGWIPATIWRSSLTSSRRAQRSTIGLAYRSLNGLKTRRLGRWIAPYGV
jgi:hypothetical protein